jgi:hypothetical protein
MKEELLFKNDMLTLGFAGLSAAYSEEEEFEEYMFIYTNPNWVSEATFNS